MIHMAFTATYVRMLYTAAIEALRPYMKDSKALLNKRLVSIADCRKYPFKAIMNNQRVSTIVALDHKYFMLLKALSSERY